MWGMMKSSNQQLWRSKSSPLALREQLQFSVQSEVSCQVTSAGHMTLFGLTARGDVSSGHRGLLRKLQKILLILSLRATFLTFLLLKVLLVLPHMLPVLDLGESP